VDVLCTDFHPVTSVKGISGRHRYRRAAAQPSLLQAIDRSAPEFIVALDDIALGHLQSLRRTGSRHLAELIERSLGPSETYDIVTSRVRFIAAAQAAGLDAPDCAEIATTAELETWLGEFGVPAFMKLDGTSGGEGVRLLREASEARAAFAAVSLNPGAPGRFERGTGAFKLTKSDSGLPTKSTVSFQKLVTGQAANCSAFAWQGTVLDVVSVLTLETLYTFGVATLVRPVENRAMRHAAVTIARELKLSGFFGIDFILQDDGNRAWVLELNARPTPVSHFALGPGRDLLAALISKVGGRPIVERPVSFRPDTDVAIFPHLLRDRDVGSERQDDLPIGQPQLVGAFTRRRQLADLRDQVQKRLGTGKSAGAACPS
jgi:hypothetical protein